METLGLSGPSARQDSIFRRIFWPSTDSVDADMLGQQGFWICLIVAAVSLITSGFQGHFILGVLFGIFYLLGGVGVREHDLFAAASVTLVYLVNLAAAVLMTRQFPGVLTLFFALVLIANVRGCWIASKWLRAGDPDLIPLRMNETWRDKLVDQMPSRAWPHIRIPFYVLASVALLLTMTGSITLIVRTRSGAVVPPPDAVVRVRAQ